MTTLGAYSSASSTNSTAAGILSKADGEHSTAVGTNASALNTASSAFGRDSYSNGENSTAIGAEARAIGSKSFLLAIRPEVQQVLMQV